MIKTPADVDKMRAAGSIVARVHARLRDMIRPGVTTGELDEAANIDD